VVAWLLSGVGLLFSITALALVRRQARRLDSLTQSYWELRYDYTRLRSRLSRLDPEDAIPAEPQAEPAPPSVSFVPLSTLKKKDK
jgi:hypothetical protein